MSIYYPSVMANIRMTFDTSLKIIAPPPPKSVEDAVSRIAKALSLPSLPSIPETEALIVSTGSALNASFVSGRVPKSATISLPGHRPAGTFSLTFDYSDLPIDPRTVKGAAVDIFLGTVTATNFAAGMGDSPDTREETSVLRPNAVGSAASLIMTAMVDEWEVEHGEDGSTVTISGRDMRGVLIDAPIATDPQHAHDILDHLPMTGTIVEVIDALVKACPLFIGLTLEVVATDWPKTSLGLPGPLPSPGKDSVAQHTKGAKGKNKGKATAACSHDKLTFWDLITKWCFLCGAIPYFVGTTLHISPARGLYAQKRARIQGLLSTSFAGGKPRIIDQETGSVVAPMYLRKLIYGRDISSLSYKRKYAGWARPKNVIVTSTDLSKSAKGAAVIQGIYPPADKKVVTRVSANGKSEEAESLYIPVAGVHDVAQLQVIAEAVYHEIGSGESGGSCETVNLASFGGDNADPDLLKLRPGDAVELGVDTRSLKEKNPLVSPYVDSLRIGFEEQIKILTSKLKDVNLARVVAATSHGKISSLQNFFRVSEVHFNWSEEGLKISFEYHNFIEALHNPGGGVTSLPGGPTRTKVRA